MAVVVDNAVVPPDTCQPAVKTQLAVPLAELRSTTLFAVEILTSDGAATSESQAYPVKVVLAKSDGTVVKTLLDEPRPLGKLALDFTPAAEKNLPTGALQL